MWPFQNGCNDRAFFSQLKWLLLPHSSLSYRISFIPFCFGFHLNCIMLSNPMNNTTKFFCGTKTDRISSLVLTRIGSNKKKNVIFETRIIISIKTYSLARFELYFVPFSIPGSSFYSLVSFPLFCKFKNVRPYPNNFFAHNLQRRTFTNFSRF